MIASARLETKYENRSAKFLVKSFDYQKQFCHLYAHRLAEMTTLLKVRARERWGADYAILKLCELREEQQDSCIIIGTIYKHQTHKPSILREISEENQLAPQPPRQHYADPEDKLILEDELQRVRLFGKVDTRVMATGVVCAVLGSIEEDGRFDVEDILFFEGGPQRPLPERRNNCLLVLVSGLDQVQSHNYVDSLNLFQHWLGGNIGSHQKKSAVRLIVAGNSVRSVPEQRQPTLQMRNAEPSDTVNAMCELDTWFAAWSRTLPVDVMPGPHDPANFMLPQQPFHDCMFPKAARNSSFRGVSNPYECVVDDVLITGTSGQNVGDLLRCTTIDEPMEALRRTLIWSHVAPTSPDTLACYPYIDSDPFILRECPHIYFAGDNNKFSTELHVGSQDQRTRLVCVPNFSKTQSIAVVDLRTLDCYEICFKTLE